MAPHLTGLRQDNYAKAHSLIAEQEKSPSERGLFLHPELFNEPEEKGSGYLRAGVRQSLSTTTLNS